MANMSANTLALIAAGQPIKQNWFMRCPTSSSHAGYADHRFGEQLGPIEPADDVRVTNPGSRTYEVWNPHPMAKTKAKAPRYIIEVDNKDGYFLPGAGSAFDPSSTYFNDYTECFLMHRIGVWDPVAVAWVALTFMDYVGKVLQVQYIDGATPDGTPVPKSATIITEMAAAWQVFRHVYNKADADDVDIDDPAGLGTFSWTV